MAKFAGLVLFGALPILGKEMQRRADEAIAMLRAAAPHPDGVLGAIALARVNANALSEIMEGK